MSRLLDMDRADAQVHERVPDGWGGRWYGVAPALVVDIIDPQGQGRILVSLPWSPDGGGAGYQAWARTATLFAGDNRGSWFLPEVGDEVLVAFEHGSPTRPYVLGGLWNGKDRPHETVGGSNAIKSIRSRNGVKITLDDSDGQERFRVETPGGHSITLKDGDRGIAIEDSNGNSIKLEPAGITVTAAAKVTVNASQVAVSAGMVTVDAAMSRFSGVVQCDTLISNTVVSATYTPGAGNIW